MVKYLRVTFTRRDGSVVRQFEGSFTPEGFVERVEQEMRDDQLRAQAGEVIDWAPSKCEQRVDGTWSDFSGALEAALEVVLTRRLVEVLEMSMLQTGTTIH